METYSYTYPWLQMVRPPQPTHRGGGGNIMCTCSIFVCRHKNNDMSTLLGHAHTYIPTDRQTDTQAYIHKSIQTYSYTNTWLCMCFVSPLWGGEPGGAGSYIYIHIYLNKSMKIPRYNIFTAISSATRTLIPTSSWCRTQLNYNQSVAFSYWYICTNKLSCLTLPTLNKTSFKLFDKLRNHQTKSVRYFPEKNMGSMPFLKHIPYDQCMVYLPTN